MPSIAVLLSCYNRKHATLRCLRDLASAALPDATIIDVYLVDDASSDGTGDAVRKEFPYVHLMKGNGHLYWGGGMRLAFSEAMKAGHDFFLWLNDDVELFSNAIVNLTETYQCVLMREGRPVIVVGATCDPDTGLMTYGGRQRRSWHPLRFEKVEPNEREPVVCETMNGNAVLIPAAVAEKIGNMDCRFTQHMGDFDYGLRARKVGFKTWTCPGFVGWCRPNTRSGAWKNSAHSLAQRVRLVNTPLGLPFREWIVFAYRHGGVLGVIAGLAGYREMIFPKRQARGAN